MKKEERERERGGGRGRETRQTDCSEGCRVKDGKDWRG